MSSLVAGTTFLALLGSARWSRHRHRTRSLVRRFARGASSGRRFTKHRRPPHAEPVAREEEEEPWEEKEEKKKKKEEGEKPVKIASGAAPVFTSAAAEEEARGQGGEESLEKAAYRKRKGKTIDWSDPGLDVLQRARLAAEEGWPEQEWSKLEASTDMDTYHSLLPRSFLNRRRETQAPPAIKEFIEQNQLGKRRLRRWKKGEHRPQPFSGSDPAHNGMRDSYDDGKTSTIGRLAVAVHRGFLRHRAGCHPIGLRGQPGVFPLAERPEVAFIGCSNVGKSSLLNSITRTMKLAEARDEPGVTRSINWYKCSRLPMDVIDLPGYGFAKGADYGNLLVDFVSTRKALRLLYFLVDARCGLRPRDWEWLQLLGDCGPEKVFVLTKSDMVTPKDLGKVATIVLQDLECVPRSSKRLLIVSSRNGTGMHDLRYHMASRAIVWEKQAKKNAEKIEQKEASRPKDEFEMAVS